MRSNKYIIKVLSISLFVLISCTVFAAVRTVPGEYASIQAAIDAAVNGDTIIVSPGTYFENININGKDIVLTSTDPADPNVVAATIIDGGADGSVVTFSGTETIACQLRGFTITNGNAAGGGGVYGNLAQATIADCVITGNTADDGGGLGWCDGPITNCIITGNNATYNGGGLYWCNGPITNCIITANTADDSGGMDSCSGSITNCIITGNNATNNGGGVAWCDGLITNCIITGNNATNNGGGLYECYFGPITNCTVVGNSANTDGGGFLDCNAPITNCIIWNNSAGGDGDQLYNSAAPNYSCIQDWTGGGPGNITSDPLFADTASSDPNEWDLHLKSEYGRWDSSANQWVFDAVTTPCIDAGDPNSTQWQNELWPHGGQTNMGSYAGTTQASMSSDAISVGNLADLNNDDAVNMIDFAIFSLDWQVEQLLMDTDLNRDGIVDIADLTDFAIQWLWQQE